MPTVNDPLDQEQIEQYLPRTPFLRSYRLFQETASTNLFLRELSDDEPGALLAVADHQTRGRGRFARRWLDAPGKSLLFSLRLDAPRPLERWPLLTLGMAVSVCRAIGRAGAAASIRWPNDVLIRERKVCGILAEPAALPNRIVIGVGLNVHQAAEDFPPELREIATSLAHETAAAPNRTDLLIALLDDFAGLYEHWLREDDGAILDECRRRMSTLGRYVRLNCQGRIIEGVMLDLESDGGMALRESSGVISRHQSAGVEECRWAGE